MLASTLCIWGWNSQRRARMSQICRRLKWLWVMVAVVLASDWPGAAEARPDSFGADAAVVHTVVKEPSASAALAQLRQLAAEQSEAASVSPRSRILAVVALAGGAVLALLLFACWFLRRQFARGDESRRAHRHAQDADEAVLDELRSAARQNPAAVAQVLRQWAS